MLLYVHRDRTGYLGTIRAAISTRAVISTFTQLLNSGVSEFKFSVVYAHTETTRTIRDGEPRMATSTFTQLLSSECLSSSLVLLYVHRDHKDYYGDFGEPRTFTSTFTQLLSSDRASRSSSVSLYVHRDHKDY